MVAAARSSVLDNTASATVVAAIERLSALQNRGPAPPDCGHAVCQVGIECEKLEQDGDLK